MTGDVFRCSLTRPHLEHRVTRDRRTIICPGTAPTPALVRLEHMRQHRDEVAREHAALNECVVRFEADLHEAGLL